MPDGGDCCAGYADLRTDWHKQQYRIRELEGALHGAFMAMCAQRDSPDTEVFQDAIDALGTAALSSREARPIDADDPFNRKQVEAVCRAVCNVEGVDPNDTEWTGESPWTRYADAVAEAIRGTSTVLARPMDVTALIAELRNEKESIFRHPDIDGLCERAADALDRLARPMDADTALSSREARPIDVQRIKDAIDTRINDLLCETKPGYDDSIVGINDAWGIVRKVFEKYTPREARQTFTIPDGHEAIRDAEGRATGETRPMDAD